MVGASSSTELLVVWLAVDDDLLAIGWLGLEVFLPIFKSESNAGRTQDAGRVQREKGKRDPRQGAQIE